MFPAFPLYVIPTATINPIYVLQEVMCMLLVILMIAYSLIEAKDMGKIILTMLSLPVILVHYLVLFLASKHEEVLVLPLFIIEKTYHGAAFSVDFGQILVIVLIYMWRKQIITRIKRFIKRDKAERNGEVKSIKTPE